MAAVVSGTGVVGAKSLNSGEILWVEWTGMAERLDVGVREREGPGKMKFWACQPPKWRSRLGLMGGGVAAKVGRRMGMEFFREVGRACPREGWGASPCASGQEL